MSLATLSFLDITLNMTFHAEKIEGCTSDILLAEFLDADIGQIDITV